MAQTFFEEVLRETDFSNLSESAQISHNMTHMHEYPRSFPNNVQIREKKNTLCAFACLSAHESSQRQLFFEMSVLGTLSSWQT